MRQYTLDGIELALKEIEHRKDCKTAAGIIRKMITTEKLNRGKHKIKHGTFEVKYQCTGIKQTWFNKLLKKVGL